MKKLLIVLGAVAALIVAGGAGASAASLITSAQIKDHTILKRDLSPTTVTALHASESEPPQYEQYMSGWVGRQVPGAAWSPGQGALFAMEVTCNAGYLPISGGVAKPRFTLGNGHDYVADVTASYADDSNPTAWVWHVEARVKDLNESYRAVPAQIEGLFSVVCAKGADARIARNK